MTSGKLVREPVDSAGLAMRAADSLDIEDVKGSVRCPGSSSSKRYLVAPTKLR